MQNANAQFSRIEKAIASLNQMPERYRVYDRKSWSDLLGLRLFLFAQLIVPYPQPRNFTLGRRLQDKKRHDVDRLMVRVMSFIVYGGVSGEARRQQGSDLFHYSFEKSFIAVYHIIYNVSVADCLEVLPCTVNLGFFNQSELHGGHRAFCLSNKITLICGIVHDMVAQVTLCFQCVCSEHTLDCRLCKDIRIVAIIQHIVCNMLNDGSRS